jgi:hypothetical protein
MEWEFPHLFNRRRRRRTSRSPRKEEDPVLLDDDDVPLEGVLEIMAERFDRHVGDGIPAEGFAEPASDFLVRQQLHPQGLYPPVAFIGIVNFKAVK